MSETLIKIQPLISEIMREVTISTMNSKPTKGSALTLLEIIQANETAALGGTLIETIDFQNGHKKELIETLSQMQGSEKTKKYPLNYLVQDFAEEVMNQSGLRCKVSLNIIIAHQTQPTFKIIDREEKVFKPVLIPIYQEFMKQLCKHPLVNNYDRPKHTRIDRAYWGRSSFGGNDQNMLTDYCDAIEIQNLELFILFKNC